MKYLKLLTLATIVGINWAFESSTSSYEEYDSTEYPDKSYSEDIDAESEELIPQPVSRTLPIAQRPIGGSLSRRGVITKCSLGLNQECNARRGKTLHSYCSCAEFLHCVNHRCVRDPHNRPGPGDSIFTGRSRTDEVHYYDDNNEDGEEEDFPVQRPIAQRPVVQRPVVQRPVVQRPISQRPRTRTRRPPSTKSRRTSSGIVQRPVTTKGTRPTNIGNRARPTHRTKSQRPLTNTHTHTNSRDANWQRAVNQRPVHQRPVQIPHSKGQRPTQQRPLSNTRQTVQRSKVTNPVQRPVSRQRLVSNRFQRPIVQRPLTQGSQSIPADLVQRPIDAFGREIMPHECALGLGNECGVPRKSLAGYCDCGENLRCYKPRGAREGICVRA